MERKEFGGIVEEITVHTYDNVPEYTAGSGGTAGRAVMLAEFAKVAAQIDKSPIYSHDYNIRSAADSIAHLAVQEQFAKLSLPVGSEVHLAIAVRVWHEDDCIFHERAPKVLYHTAFKVGGITPIHRAHKSVIQ